MDKLKKPEIFARSFIEEFLRSSFGSMSKKELELLIFKLLLKDRDELTKYNKFELSKLLKISESKDIVKLKGGENIYLVVDTVDIKTLREFQIKGHCLQKQDRKFKLVPPNFQLSLLRSDNAN